MFRATTALAILLAATGGHIARADFVELSQVPDAASVGPRAATNGPVPRHTTSRPAAFRPSRPRIPVASGFGRHIPLSFAARQIVPASVRVIYANDIDASAAVDWKGGQAWTVVLARAVAPLGLHLQISPTTVTIYR